MVKLIVNLSLARACRTVLELVQADLMTPAGLYCAAPRAWSVNAHRLPLSLAYLERRSVK